MSFSQVASFLGAFNSLHATQNTRVFHNSHGFYHSHSSKLNFDVFLTLLSDIGKEIYGPTNKALLLLVLQCIMPLRQSEAKYKALLDKVEPISESSVPASFSPSVVPSVGLDTEGGAWGKAAAVAASSSSLESSSLAAIHRKQQQQQQQQSSPDSLLAFLTDCSLADFIGPLRDFGVVTVEVSVAPVYVILSPPRALGPPPEKKKYSRTPAHPPHTPLCLLCRVGYEGLEQR